MIRRNITYKEKSLIIPLYKAIVRPHLEYCIQACNPHLRKDVDMLEKIQRRATDHFRFLLIGLEKFEKVLQIIIDYDDSSTR